MLITGNKAQLSDFKAKVEGNVKHNIINYNIDGNDYIHFYNHEDNIDALFISRFFKFLDIKTFNVNVLYHEKKPIILVENLFSKRKSFQLEDFLSQYLLFLNNTYGPELFYKEKILFLLGDRDNFIINSIFTDKNIFFIDLKQLKPIY